ncbi:hypothetical protein [Mesorhizobium sp.]|uniref:hypothetical protein n=1 Tax=Mesorhizobium sp. TaxID=1871066 RepID=UPI00342B9B26
MIALPSGLFLAGSRDGSTLVRTRFQSCAKSRRYLDRDIGQLASNARRASVREDWKLVYPVADLNQWANQQTVKCRATNRLNGKEHEQS